MARARQDRLGSFPGWTASAWRRGNMGLRRLRQLRRLRLQGYERAPSLIAKRLLDVVVSLLVLTICLPVLVIVALLVLVRLGRPVLFVQERPGLHGKLFPLYKFRSMRDLRGADGTLLHDQARLTGLGRFLRKISLDELPGLFNVLRGDMSLVGPRPLLVEYLSLYSPEQLRRHDVKPGITGMAQVCGRNELSWEEKFACDLYYVENRTLWLDVTILVRTIPRVVRCTGVTPSDTPTVEYFTGSQLEQPPLA